MENIIIIAVLLIIVISIIVYIDKKWKQGVKCIGCPHAKECANRCTCNTKH